MQDGETLILEFITGATYLTDLILRGANHVLFGDGDSIIVENSNGVGVYTVGSSDLIDWGASDTWYFYTNSEAGDKEFYISSVSAVPVPAAGFLLLGGLGGLAMLRRRKTK